jgi:hypothetical protein
VLDYPLGEAFSKNYGTDTSRQRPHTPAIRRSIQRSQESIQTLESPPKTVAKSRKRTTTTDAPMGLNSTSTVLTTEGEAIAVALCQHTLRPLDGCLYALQET